MNVFRRLVLSPLPQTSSNNMKMLLLLNHEIEGAESDPERAGVVQVDHLPQTTSWRFSRVY